MLKKIFIIYKNFADNISIQNNIILMIAYRIIITIIPLVTTPYISRILSPETIGNYSYTQSVCAYFGAFAGLGASAYGQREIAFFKDDKVKYSKIFWEINFIRLIATLVSCGLYLYAVIDCFDSALRLYFLIQFISMIGGLLDISWFFFGLENFFIVVKKNLFLRLMTIGGIFFFVKDPQDIYIYVFINSIALVLSGLIFWIEIFHYVMYIPICEYQLTKHIWPMIVFFFPSVAETLYSKLDITMLGLFSRNPSEIACYEQTVKISTISVSTISTVGSVVAPRIAYVFFNGDKQELKKYFWKGFDAFCLIGIPVAFGLYAIADTFIPWFLGSQYIKVSILLKIMAPVCLLNGMNNYLGSQYLGATKRQTLYTSIIMMGLLTNIFFNYFLILQMESIGAVIASLISESFILIVEIYIIRKEIDFLKALNIVPKKIISAFFMCILVKLFSAIPLDSTIKIISQIFLGIFIYGIILLILKDSLMDEITGKILRRRR